MGGGGGEGMEGVCFLFLGRVAGGGGAQLFLHFFYIFWGLGGEICLLLLIFCSWGVDGGNGRDLFLVLVLVLGGGEGEICLFLLLLFFGVWGEGKST